MNLQEKQDVVATMSGQFSEAGAAFVVAYKGCTCEELTGLRKKLRTSGSELAVVKNTLAKLAIADTSASVLADHFVGPVAVIWAKEDPVSPAKVISDFAKESEAFTLRGGVVDGAPVDQAGIEALANLPTKEELLSKLLALINAPATQLLRTINAPASNLVGLLEAWRAKKEETGE